MEKATAPTSFPLLNATEMPAVKPLQQGKALTLYVIQRKIILDYGEVIALTVDIHGC